MSEIQTKSVEVLKVFGTTIRAGVFTGGKAVSGVLMQDTPTPFTPSKIAKIYENITTHVPFYIGHSLDPSRRVIGYSYKFGVNETLDDLQYEGFVFDKDAKTKIGTEGYDKVSPEFLDDECTILSGIAFLPNPAIAGTEAELEIKVFSNKGEDSNMTSEGNANVDTNRITPQVSNNVAYSVSTTDNTGGTWSLPSGNVYVPTVTSVGTPYVPTPSVPDTPKVDTPKIPEVTPEVTSVPSDIDTLRKQVESQSAKIDEMLTEKYNIVVGELKSLGVEDPGSIVRGLPVEQKNSVLSKMKDSIVKNKPLTSNTSGANISGAGKPEKEKVIDEVLGELGFDRETYKKITGG
jgi:hypothetical protein